MVIVETELLILPEPDTLESMDNMALALNYQGNYDEAEGMHRRALEGREKVLGKEHPDTLSSMNNMALVLDYQGKYHEAERMHRQVLDIRQKVQVPEHPDRLTSMGNLALVLDNQGKYDEAEGIHRRVRPSYHCGVIEALSTHQCLRIYSNGSQT